MASTAAPALSNGLSLALGPLARALTRRYARILMYHRFSAHEQLRRMSVAVFEQHVRYISRNFTPRRLRDVVHKLRAQQDLDNHSVVLTVDDGYRDFMEHAYPILLRYGVPATIYVVTEFADGRIWLWPDALHWLISAAATGHCRLDLSGIVLELDLTSPACRNASWSRFGMRLMELSTEDRWAAIRKLESRLGLELPARPTAEYAPMSWDDLRGLDPELIEIGSHTCTHPILSRCTAAQQSSEIASSKEILERRLGRSVEAFCYPHGESRDFTVETQAIVAQCGFTSAAVAFGGLVNGATQLGQLTRLPASDDMFIFRNSVNGIGRIKQALRIPD